jgi:hypothetical protein
LRKGIRTFFFLKNLDSHFKKPHQARPYTMCIDTTFHHTTTPGIELIAVLNYPTLIGNLLTIFDRGTIYFILRAILRVMVIERCFPADIQILSIGCFFIHPNSFISYV